MKLKILKSKIHKIKNHVKKIERPKIMSTSRPHVKNHKIQNLKKLQTLKPNKQMPIYRKEYSYTIILFYNF